MGTPSTTYTARDARYARQNYQHIAAVVNRILNRIMETMEDEAAAKKYFRPSVFSTVHALHAFFHGQDLSKKELMKSHKFVAPYFDYRGDPERAASFMGTRLDALRAAEQACGREFVTIQRADGERQLYTWYKAHPLLTAAEWVYLQARQKPDYWKCPAAAITDELLDAAIAMLPEVERPAKREPAAPSCGHPAESGECEECGEHWEAADVTAGQVLKGRWTKWENAARAILEAEFDKGGDPEIVAQCAALKIIDLGKEIKKRRARERLRGLMLRPADEIADSPYDRGGGTSTEEILDEVMAAPRTDAQHSGKDSAPRGAEAPGPDPTEKSVAPLAETLASQHNMETPSDAADVRLSAALDYAAQGLPVLPLWGCSDGICDCSKGAAKHSIGKHPHGQLARNGVYSATTDEAVIRRWFARDPRINIGVAMGGPLNLICVDVDPRNDGDATYFDLVEAHGADAFPETFTVRTGGNGWHRLYRLPEAIKAEKGELKGEIGPGVDIKGTGGYIVGVGSVHESGRVYEVETNTYIAEAPVWLVAAVRKAAAGEKAEKVVDFQAHRDRKRSGVALLHK
jgi:hypothetical protein